MGVVLVFKPESQAALLTVDARLDGNGVDLGLEGAPLLVEELDKVRRELRVLGGIVVAHRLAADLDAPLLAQGLDDFRWRLVARQLFHNGELNLRRKFAWHLVWCFESVV